MELKVVDVFEDQVEPLVVSDANFNAEFNETLVHQVSVACRAVARAGTSAQKNRSAVAGGGAKPVRQKGTGRARLGTLSSPLRRSGGRTFARSTRDYSQKVNRKSFRAAMRSILSEAVRRGNLTVVSNSNMELSEPKTKTLAERLLKLELSSALIVDKELHENLKLASRNLPNVRIVESGMLNPAMIQDCSRVLMTADAVKSVDEWLQ